VYLFFKKVHRVANVRSLVFAMKHAYVHVKNTKQRYLKKYIFHSATKIQSLIRGFLDRRIKLPMLRKLGDNARKLRGLALGWKVRRIMKLKEVKNRIQ